MILYYTDKYAYNVMGTKRSLFEELARRGVMIQWMDLNQIRNVLEHVKYYKANEIWLAHLGLEIPAGIKPIVPVVGFGFSDPWGFDPKRLKCCDRYVTNHYGIYLKYKDIMPCFYNPTACDLHFHKPLELPKKYPVSIIGRGKHIRFKDPRMRLKFVNRLRSEGIEVHTFGVDWPSHACNHPPVGGQDFLKIINQTRLCIDLQSKNAPLAHRMMEYGACGVPVITRARPEIDRTFRVGIEILTYEHYEDLRDTIKRVLERQVVLVNHGKFILEACKSKHTMVHRVDHLMNVLNLKFEV